MRQPHPGDLANILQPEPAWRSHHGDTCGIDTWSQTSLQQRLMKTGGRLIKHARYYWLLPAEGHLTRGLFGAMLRRLVALSLPAG